MRTVLARTSYGLGAVLFLVSVLAWWVVAQAEDTTFLDCRDIMPHARYLVEHIPTGVEAWPRLSPSICTPCSCITSMASCYAYLADQEKAKEQTAQALETHRDALRALLDRCESIQESHKIETLPAPRGLTVVPQPQEKHP